MNYVQYAVQVTSERVAKLNCSGTRAELGYTWELGLRSFGLRSFGLGDAKKATKSGWSSPVACSRFWRRF